MRWGRRSGSRGFLSDGFLFARRLWLRNTRSHGSGRRRYRDRRRWRRLLVFLVFLMLDLVFDGCFGVVVVRSGFGRIEAVIPAQFQRHIFVN